MTAETDKLVTALKEHGEALERNSKMQYIKLMQEQVIANNRTPTAILFGSYGFNPGNSVAVLAQWRQIVPHNPRRKRITISAVGQSLYLSHSETEIGISDLIKWQQLGVTGRIPACLISFANGPGLQVETTEAIYVASLTGAGSPVEQGAVVNWVEEIYSALSANPLIHIETEKANTPGDIEKLSPSLQGAFGDIEAHFTREGVR